MPTSRKKPAAIGIKAAYPGFIEPALATSIDKVPSGERWVHEIKFDGYRVQVHLRDAAVKVFTRRGNDWTNRFRKIATDAWHINVGSAIIDGEVVVPARDGATDFSVLQNELRSKKIVMVAFNFALPQWLRPAKAAAVRAQGLAPEDHSRDRRLVQRELRGRWRRDVQARLHGRP
jgi:bifunctional non-homologous end joining protein LigD